MRALEFITGHVIYKPTLYLQIPTENHQWSFIWWGQAIKKLCIEEGEERTIIHSLKKKKFSFGKAIYHLYLTVIVVWTIVMKAFFPVGGWHFELQQFVLNPC